MKISMWKTMRFYILLFILIPVDLGAQLLRSEYFTGDRKAATPKNYAIRRDIMQMDSGFVMDEFSKKGKRQFTGHYTSIDPVIEHGAFKFYDNQGFLEAEGTYTNGEMSGIWIFYDDDRSVKKKVNYDFAITECISGDTSGMVNTYDVADSNSLETIPVFQNGDPKLFYQFLYRELVFPPLLKLYFESGIVIGRFTVDTLGNVCDVYTDGTSNKDLEKETRRVLSLLTGWQPGKLGNRPVKVKYTCPISFKLQ
jgi:hypothetical protein